MTKLQINGMTCANCARHVTEAIQSVPGIRSATVSLEKKNAVINWNSGAVENLPAVFEAVKNAGYEAKESPSESCGCASCQAPAKKNWPWNLWLGILVTAFLMMGEWVFGWMMQPWFRWLSFSLSGAVQSFSGAPFYRGAWRQLKSGNSNMDTLVALGSTTAFGFSCWALFRGGGHLYFMEAAAIITLISLGHFFEARVSEKAGGALKSLMELAPQTARKISNSEFQTPNSTNEPFNLRAASFSKSAIRNRQSAIEREVPVSELKIGDEIALRPGDRVPVDGIVRDGESAVDESSLTGESNPVGKKTGDELFAGTVNLNGRLMMRVTATGEETGLAHIVAAVQRAQSSRAEIQRIGDRVSSVFVPAVVAIAVAAGIFWAIHSGAEEAIVVAAGVLIVACPCAMGLATPAAIMAGANSASRRGILIRDGVALEKAGKISAIVFDKTGTLTEGKPKVVANQIFPNELPAELREFQVEELAASIGALSNHPLSKAIAAKNSARHSLKNFQEISGGGIQALLAEKHLLQLGSLRWLVNQGADWLAARNFADEWMQKGATVVGLAANGGLMAVFALRDQLKSQTKTVVSELAKNNFIYLVTGDSPTTAQAIAKEIGIDIENVFSEVRPEQKAEFVKKLQSQGERVAFVGDGINDAPALSQADLGIAVSRASDIAREAADIILLKSEIEAVPEALGLARATLRTIKQNLFWAFVYNAVGVPLAAFGFISPILCAAAMGASDLIVIGNALRLLRWRK